MPRQPPRRPRQPTLNTENPSSNFRRLNRNSTKMRCPSIWMYVAFYAVPFFPSLSPSLFLLFFFSSSLFFLFSLPLYPPSPISLSLGLTTPQDMQKLEEERIDKMKDWFLRMVTLQETLPPAVNTACAAMRKASESIDRPQDIAQFIAQNKSGTPKPPEAKYEPYVVCACLLDVHSLLDFGSFAFVFLYRRDNVTPIYLYSFIFMFYYLFF